MLHTKIQDHVSIGSGQEFFKGIFTIYGHGGHVGQLTQLIFIDFHSSSPISFHIKLGLNDPTVSEKKF